ncbi:MAG: discoidin domain-containing protein [Lentisphaeria bacterium]|nr:discoidin domain-containing protein [Lentisphaeria bacterium]
MKHWIIPAILLAGSLCAQELVKNGNFDPEGAGSVPKDWQDETRSWLTINDDGSVDSGSVRFVPLKNAKAALRQIIECKPSTSYLLKASFKSEGAVPVIRVLGGNGKKVLAELKADPKVKDEWKDYSVKFRTGSRTKKVTVEISAEGEGQAKVDSVSVAPPTKGKAPVKVKEKEDQDLFVPPAGTVNLALNRPYVLKPRAGYKRCMDDGDAVQLTDGKFTKGFFWTQKSTVGWTKQPFAHITVDLGKVEPIRGFLLSFAGNSNGGYPEAIHIYTSNDQKDWYYLGDLLGTSEEEIGKADREHYFLYRAASMNMPTCGRWVCFTVKIPGKHFFADEVMVFKGDDKLLAAGPVGIKVDSPGSSFMAVQMRAHFRKDADAILAAAKALPADQQKQLAQDLDKIVAIPDKFENVLKDDFIPLLPLHPIQERVFAKNNVVLNALGYTKPMFWQNCRWDNLSPVAVPPKGSTPEAVVVDMMPGEVRAETINLLNPTDKVLDYKVTVEGLPTEANLDCREVLFMDTKQFEYVAAALKPGQGNSVTVKVHPGMSRQIWFSFVKPKLEAGLYKGTVKATADGAPAIEIPLHLAISKVKFPERPRLHLGGWDYTDFHGKYYHTLGNLKSNLAMLRKLYVDSPCARQHIMPYGAKYDKDGHLLNPDSLNYSKWDAWIEMWPDARWYKIAMKTRLMVWAGEPAGTPRFNRMIKEYMTAFGKHLRATKKVMPEQVIFGLVDEPRSHVYDQKFITWAKPIRAAEQGFLLFENPIYSDPTQALPGLFELSDILCPNIRGVLTSEKLREFYAKQQKAGKILNLYACTGPARLLDPIYYYRAQEWQCFALGATGSYFWAFGCGGGKGDSWHAYRQPSHEYSPYYVSPTDTMEAKQSEGIREGVQDYEYLSMLKDRVAELKKAGKNSPELAEAEKFLVEGPRTVIAHYTTFPKGVETGSQRFHWVMGTSVRWKSGNDRSLTDKIRIKALRLLEKLQ